MVLGCPFTVFLFVFPSGSFQDPGTGCAVCLVLTLKSLIVTIATFVERSVKNEGGMLVSMRGFS